MMNDHPIALLLSLRGIYAVQPNLGVAYVNGIAVNYTGLAGDIS